MGRLILVVVLALGCVAVGLVLIPMRANAPAPVGYHLRGDRVSFEFKPRRWPITTLIATGDTVPMRELRVRRVSVVGAFNDWTPGAWPMDRDEGDWRLRRPRAGLGGDNVTFAFVVNDRFWVEPAPSAANRVEAPLAGGRRGLRLPAPAPR